MALVSGDRVGEDSDWTAKRPERRRVAMHDGSSALSCDGPHWPPATPLVDGEGECIGVFELQEPLPFVMLLTGSNDLPSKLLAVDGGEYHDEACAAHACYSFVRTGEGTMTV